MMLVIVLLLTSLAGLCGSFYISFRKTWRSGTNDLLGADGHMVINSVYAKFFEVPVEYLGIGYFTAMTGISLLLLGGLEIQVITDLLPLLLSSFALLFATYLAGFQIFVLRNSSIFPFFINILAILSFAAVVAILSTDIAPLLRTYYVFLIPLHLLGIALGLGTATVTDILFFKFLSNLNISRFEGNVIHTLSQIIWLGLAVLLVSGLGLFIPNYTALFTNPFFLMKMIALAVLLINGVFVNLVITPALIHIRSFGKDHVHPNGGLKHDRKIIFASGALSLTSWYFICAMGQFLYMGMFDFPTLLFSYIVLVATAIIGSQALRWIFTRRLSTALKTDT